MKLFQKKDLTNGFTFVMVNQRIVSKTCRPEFLSGVPFKSPDLYGIPNQLLSYGDVLIEMT